MGVKGLKIETDNFTEVQFEYDFERSRSSLSIIDEASKNIYKKDELSREDFLEIMKRLKTVIDDCISTMEDTIEKEG